MARPVRGSTFETANGVGIRWPEAGKRKQRSGFRTRTEARAWFAEHVAPRLRSGGPAPDVTFDAFADVFLARHGQSNIEARTIETLTERLTPARATFGSWTLHELEGAADDVARWRAGLPAGSRYRHTLALRQVLGAAVRWRYIARNPAVDAGRNPEPRREELRPFTLAEIDRIAVELGAAHGPLVIFAAETGLRTGEWAALERRDVDRPGRAVTVQRRASRGQVTPYPKTERSRRRVPLSQRALNALDQLPPRLDSPLLFPAPEGGLLRLENWRNREWTPALTAAGIDQRGPYTLRHTFATEALAAGLDLRAGSAHGRIGQGDRLDLRASRCRLARPPPRVARRSPRLTATSMTTLVPFPFAGPTGHQGPARRRAPVA